jgi:hypothetical protein
MVKFAMYDHTYGAVVSQSPLTLLVEDTKVAPPIHRLRGERVNHVAKCASSTILPILCHFITLGAVSRLLLNLHLAQRQTNYLYSSSKYILLTR